MNDQRFYSLKELQEAAYKATEEACRETRAGRLHDAFNIEGIQCNYAREWREQNGSHGYTVYIQEASPDAVRLRRFIRDRLESNGFEDIEVVTEW